jgi:hypothetical protein
MTTPIQDPNIVKMLEESGLPFAPTAEGLAELIRSYEELHAKAVTARLQELVANGFTLTITKDDWKEFPTWIRSMADGYAKAIWSNDPIIVAHVKWLRDWADTIEKLNPAAQ